VDVERFGSRVLETSHEGRRYVLVFYGARERRDGARRLQLLTKMLIAVDIAALRHAPSGRRRSNQARR
jgi:hypothetical protein